eukprot:PRCOL_00006969-RA
MAPIKTVLFVIAMDQEAAPFVAAEGLAENASVKLPMTPAKVFSGEVGGARVHVAINGTDTAHGVPAVGTVPAALTTYAAIAELSPDLIINYGDYHIAARDAVDVHRLAGELGFKTGVVTTGNSLDATKQCMDRMGMAEANVKDMEAAAIAYVAEAADVPWFCVKSVTDIVDGDKPTEEEFLENLGAAAESLQKALPRVLDAVAGKELGAIE